MAASKETTERAREARQRLTRAIPSPQVELDHDGAWQLLIATILSAQSTDKTINRVTPKLFARFANPSSLGAADPEEVEELVKSTGFFRNKAKAIQGASRAIAERFDGEVPKTLEELTALPGVARKTANLVLGVAFGIASGMVVDTHVGRVARRLELSAEKDAVKIERDLCELFAKQSWVDTSHRLLLHGRYICSSKKPGCARCPLTELCPSAEAEPAGRWTALADAERVVVESRGGAGS